eukprot:TRINITY_DN2045_c0_g1_i1.p2 TRINITY_DN2045_c0_g1~~TRINITY_DN2045_c0_g1_i1.p2  ORF type:complete len:60 (-),score=12.64 TRINITY_DN2045_c0_g1_i1:27-206(-)
MVKEPIVVVDKDVEPIITEKIKDTEIKKGVKSKTTTEKPITKVVETNQKTEPPEVWPLV